MSFAAKFMSFQSLRRRILFLPKISEKGDTKLVLKKLYFHPDILAPITPRGSVFIGVRKGQKKA